MDVRLMEIRYKTIAHKKQRYPTVGDYYSRGNGWQFRISKLPDGRFEQLVFLHELMELILCIEAKIIKTDARVIDKFDVAYEDARAAGAPPPCGCKEFSDQPGDDIHAPYHEQHVCATKCERLLAECMGVNWKEYETAIDALFEEK